MTTADIHFKCTNQRRIKRNYTQQMSTIDRGTHRAIGTQRKSDSKMAITQTQSTNIFFISFGFLIWFFFSSTNRIILIVYSNKVALCWVVMFSALDEEMRRKKNRKEIEQHIVYSVLIISLLFQSSYFFFFFVVCGTFLHIGQELERRFVLRSNYIEKNQRPL